MNTMRTDREPLEIDRSDAWRSGDWLTAEYAGRDRNLTSVVGTLVALFCLGAAAIAFWGTTHPIMARVLVALTGGF